MIDDVLPPAPPRWGWMILVQAMALSYAVTESETSLQELARGQRRLLAPRYLSLVREADATPYPSPPLILEHLYHVYQPRGPPGRSTSPLSQWSAGSRPAAPAGPRLPATLARALKIALGQANRGPSQKLTRLLTICVSVAGRNISESAHRICRISPLSSSAIRG